MSNGNKKVNLILSCKENLQKTIYKICFIDNFLILRFTIQIVKVYRPYSIALSIYLYRHQVLLNFTDINLLYHSSCL